MWEVDKGVAEQHIKNIIKEIQLKRGKIIIIWNSQNKATIEHINIPLIEIAHPTLMNPWTRKGAPETVDGTEISMGYWTPGGVNPIMEGILTSTPSGDKTGREHNIYSRQTEDKSEEEDEDETEWICPFCNKAGHRVNSFYGVCRKCKTACTEGTTQDITVGGKGYRCVETLWINHKKKERAPTEDAVEQAQRKVRMFFTDGAGEICNSTTSMKATGWATVEVSPKLLPSKDGLTIMKKKTWKTRSEGGYKSIPWCEGRAILKAIELLQYGEQGHIVTDSKGTIQALKALLTRKYATKRRIANKALLDNIISTIQDKKLGIMLEWVKSHNETEAMENQNWISDLKILGNKWADQEAGSTVTTSDPGNIPPHTGILNKLQDKETGQIVEWGQLHKLIRRSRIEARINPTKEGLKGMFPSRTRSIFNHSKGRKVANLASNLQKTQPQKGG